MPISSVAIGNYNSYKKTMFLQLAFVIIVHKSQGLILQNTVTAIGDREISLGLCQVFS